MLVAHHLRQACCDTPSSRASCAARSCWCRWPTRSAWRSGWTTNRWAVSTWTARRTSTATTRTWQRGVPEGRQRWADACTNVAPCVRRSAATCTNGRPATAAGPAQDAGLLAFDADLVLDLHCDCEAVNCTSTAKSLLAPHRAAGTPARRARPRCWPPTPGPRRSTSVCPGLWWQLGRWRRPRTWAPVSRCHRPVPVRRWSCAARRTCPMRWPARRAGHPRLAAASGAGIAQRHVPRSPAAVLCTPHPWRVPRR
jgi:hypothetical protein